MIRPYLSDKTPMNLKVHSSDKVINYEAQVGQWKIQLAMQIDFISFKDSEKTRIMHANSDNVEIMIGSETDDIIDELFESRLQRYQERLEELMRGSKFVFNNVDLLQYHTQKINLNRSGSYVDSPKWLKNKKETINSKNNDNNCFQYDLTVALNYQNIKKDPKKISKIKPFINTDDWKRIYFPSHLKDWKKLEQNNKSIALNSLFAPHNTEKIRLAYKSKYNHKRKNQVILLMITDGEIWHYLTVKNLPGLLKGITSNHKRDFYCLNCFHSYRTENKL